MTDLEMRVLAMQLAIKLYAGRGDSGTVTRAAEVILNYIKDGKVVQ